MRFLSIKRISIFLLILSIIILSYNIFQYQNDKIIEKPLLMDFLNMNEKMKSTATKLKNVSSKEDNTVYENLYIDYIYDLESISSFSEIRQYEKYNLDSFKILLITLDSRDISNYSKEIYDKLLIICSNWNQFKWDEITSFSYDFDEDPLELKSLVNSTNRLSKECLSRLKHQELTPV